MPKTVVIDEAHNCEQQHKDIPLVEKLARTCGSVSAARRHRSSTTCPTQGTTNLIARHLGLKGVFTDTFMPEEGRARMFAHAGVGAQQGGMGGGRQR